MLKLNNQHFDLLLLIQKNEEGVWTVTNIVSRLAYSNTYVTNLCEKIYNADDTLQQLYPLKKVKSILKSLSEVSINVAKHIEKNLGHLGEISVDFGLDIEGDLKIIEVNGKIQKNLYNMLDHLESRELVYKRPFE